MEIFLLTTVVASGASASTDCVRVVGGLTFDFTPLMNKLYVGIIRNGTGSKTGETVEFRMCQPQGEAGTCSDPGYSALAIKSEAPPSNLCSTVAEWVDPQFTVVPPVAGVDLGGVTMIASGTLCGTEGLSSINVHFRCVESGGLGPTTLAVTGDSEMCLLAWDFPSTAACGRSQHVDPSQPFVLGGGWVSLFVLFGGFAMCMVVAVPTSVVLSRTIMVPSEPVPLWKQLTLWNLWTAIGRSALTGCLWTFSAGGKCGPLAPLYRASGAAAFLRSSLAGAATAPSRSEYTDL